MQWNCKRSVFKNHKNCSPPGLGVCCGQKLVRPRRYYSERCSTFLVRWLHNLPCWNWMNSYWKFWIGCLHGACSVSSFCHFQKITLLRFHHIFLPFDTSKPLCFQMFCVKEYIKAYQCPNMINFDRVNFSEGCSQEVYGVYFVVV